MEQKTFVNVLRMDRPIPDDRDRELAIEYLVEWDKLEGPRVGDFIFMLNGKYERFSYEWYDSMQTTEGGSFCLGNGWVSFSGGLNPSIPFETIEPLGITKMGNFWIPHHGWLEAYCGVRVIANCRVFKQVEL